MFGQWALLILGGKRMPTFWNYSSRVLANCMAKLDQLPFELVNQVFEDKWKIHYVKAWNQQGDLRVTALSMLLIDLARALQGMRLQEPKVEPVQSKGWAVKKKINLQQTHNCWGRKEGKYSLQNEEMHFSDAMEHFSKDEEIGDRVLDVEVKAMAMAQKVEQCTIMWVGLKEATVIHNHFVVREVAAATWMAVGGAMSCLGGWRMSLVCEKASFSLANFGLCRAWSTQPAT